MGGLVCSLFSCTPLCKNSRCSKKSCCKNLAGQSVSSYLECPQHPETNGNDAITEGFVPNFLAVSNGGRLIADTHCVVLTPNPEWTQNDRQTVTVPADGSNLPPPLYEVDRALNGRHSPPPAYYETIMEILERDSLHVPDDLIVGREEDLTGEFYKLVSKLDPSSEVLLVSASEIVKVISNLEQIGRVMESFDVIEKPADELLSANANIRLLFDFCSKIFPFKKEVHTKSGKVFQYDKICLATGGRPKLISDNKFVVGIRDTESVQSFQSRLKDTKRIIIVGNGGIASELIYELKNVEVIWAIKHKSILATFIDAGAAQFFISHVNREHCKSEAITKRWKYSHSEANVTGQVSDAVNGSALGPDWVDYIQAVGSSETPKNVHVEYECEVQDIISQERFIKELLTDDHLENKFGINRTWPVYVRLTNGKIYGCDLVVSATGVVPNNAIELDGGEKFRLAADGGIIVDEQMQTNFSDIYAAGDVCTAGWKWHPHWIQMRLWTQARQMGVYAAKCMQFNSAGISAELDLCFEIFTHVTKFFGLKIVLLGVFNSQNLRSDHEAHVRMKTGEEYVKILIQDGKVQGAILIGETDLEETMENLILNETDVSGLDLLNNSVDIEDYFD